MNMGKIIELSDYSLIPGLEKNPPENSVALDEMVEISPDRFAASVLSFPGFRQVSESDSDWWSWRAECQNMMIDMSLFETEPVTWGGSILRGSCQLNEFIEFWNHLRKLSSGIWLHNSDCEILTPEILMQRMRP